MGIKAFSGMFMGMFIPSPRVSIMTESGAFSNQPYTSTDSLAACAFLVNPCSPEYAACLSNRAYPEAAEGFLLSDKRLLELRGLNGNGAPPTRDRPSGGIQQMEMDTAVAEEGVSSERGVENNRGLRYETDGGVRLAGGRVGEVATEECDSMSEGSTLPPPYSSDFGDS